MRRAAVGIRAVVRIRAVVGVTVVALVAAGCTSGNDEGNQQAFCGLLSEGVGLDAVNEDIADLEALVAVAPSEIEPSVTRLRNSARDLSEIDPLDVEELFNARFDPNALDARDALEQYAADTCNLDLTSGPPVPVDEIQTDLEQYLSTNFGDASWAGDLSLDIGTSSGRLNSIIARLLRPPADPEEPSEICRALSVFLYELRDGLGTVSVETNGDVLSFRSGPDASCTTL